MSTRAQSQVPFIHVRSRPSSAQRWIEHTSELRTVFSREAHGDDIALHVLDAYFIHALGAHLLRAAPPSPRWAELDLDAFLDDIEASPTWRSWWKPQLLLTLLAFYEFLERKRHVEPDLTASLRRRIQPLLSRWIH